MGTVTTTATVLLKDILLHIDARTRWGSTAGLAVGVSCLAIPLTGGVSLGLRRAECCSDPSQKHVGYLPPHLQRLLFSSWG